MERDRQEAWDGLVSAVERAIESGKGVQLSGRPRMYAVLAADVEMARLRAELAAAQAEIERLQKQASQMAEIVLLETGEVESDET